MSTQMNKPQSFRDDISAPPPSSLTRATNKTDKRAAAPAGPPQTFFFKYQGPADLLSLLDSMDPGRETSVDPGLSALVEIGSSFRFATHLTSTILAKTRELLTEKTERLSREWDSVVERMDEIDFDEYFKGRKGTRFDDHGKRLPKQQDWPFPLSESTKEAMKKPLTSKLVKTDLALLEHQTFEKLTLDFLDQQSTRDSLQKISNEVGRKCREDRTFPFLITLEMRAEKATEKAKAANTNISKVFTAGTDTVMEPPVLTVSWAEVRANFHTMALDPQREDLVAQHLSIFVFHPAEMWDSVTKVESPGDWSELERPDSLRTQQSVSNHRSTATLPSRSSASSRNTPSASKETGSKGIV